MLTEALLRKKNVTPEQENDSIASAQKSDNTVTTTVNIADNVVSLEAFHSKKLTVPTFSNAIK